VLLHLLRGAGVSGATGMAERAAMVVPWWDDPAGPGRRLSVWRPFLDEPKATVRAYAGRLGLAPVEDPSNADRDLRRNALRHEAMPILNQIVPGATAALARFARLAAADDAYLEEAAAAVYCRAVTERGDLRLPALAGEPPAVRRRVVRRWLRERAPACSVTAERTEAVLGLIDGAESGRGVEIGNQVTVRALAKVARVEAGVSSGGDGGRER
jgi:tRNA(Ile)-lysidine synthase